ncbi:MAG TPA: NAD+ synthase [Candidatus Diapherotrites archaeon]|uniref:NH(3)-dependent NAD(+) synthetase n=1 Tax=Candidatus Iainarchaeum sp. TaxID=3101447 RepID=A0A7J4IZS1_9ARCH|nr:NAD+ synthase [Candidatus Diapherotrites archaeon]
MNAKKIEGQLVSKISSFFKQNNKARAVLGLSGGIDSAVVLILLVKALGKENVTALILPNTQVTKQENVLDAEELANSHGVKHLVIEIDQFLRPFAALPWEQLKIAKANLNARIRALILYNYANAYNALVAGTGNKSEIYMGYFTKHGDSAADFFPIGDLYKKDVRALAKQIGLSKKFLEKVPSAELWVGQEDEREMGISYDVLDELLPIILKGGRVPQKLRDAAEKISATMKETEHKRKMPPILKL